LQDPVPTRLIANGRLWLLARATRLDPMVVVASFVTLALGLLFLERKSFFTDEVFSLNAAKLGVSDLWHLLSTSQANMSFYYLLLRLCIAILGDSEFAVRFLSVLAAAGTVPVFYLLGKELFGTRAAGFASVLLSVNAFFITYAQTARSYSLLLFLVTASSYSFLRSIRGASGGWWFAYGVTTTLAVYTHLFAVFIPFVHVLSLPLLGRGRVPWKRFTIASSAIGLCISPMGLFVLTRDVRHIIDWVVKPNLYSLVNPFLSLAGHGWPLLLSYFILCCLALRPLLAAAVDTPFGRWRAGLVLGWLFVPVVVSFLFSILIKPIFVPQYLIICLPPLVLLAAVGITSLTRRWLKVSIAGLVIFLASQSLFTSYGEQREDWRGVVSFVTSHARAGDGIIIYAPYVRGAFEYYLSKSGSIPRAPHPVFPDVPWSSNHLTEPAGPPLPSVLRSLVNDPYPRIWLVLSHESTILRERQETRSIQGSLDRSYEAMAEKTFDGVRLLLYQAPIRDR
jgi:mannosyltransferase